ncbi:hypothetical protein AB0O75_13735 [Streptomyces sp. NPDC088921]|uniref:hypothetical protein n=1 Tax=unclassified Streptomyces TaxID=2593676 RepID=UPI00343278F6
MASQLAQPVVRHAVQGLLVGAWPGFGQALGEAVDDCDHAVDPAGHRDGDLHLSLRWSYLVRRRRPVIGGTGLRPGGSVVGDGP